jgi:hypothetical protein
VASRGSGQQEKLKCWQSSIKLKVGGTKIESPSEKP